MKIAHLTTVDMSLRYLVLPQLEAALEYGESIGISAPGEYVAELEERGIRHIPLTASTRGMSLLSDIRAALQLWRVLAGEDLDVLHTHNPKPGLYGRVIGRLTGVPIVVNTVHGLYATEDSSWLKRAIVYSTEFIASRFSDAELIQSPEDLDLLMRMRLTPRSRIALLGNGVDLSRFNATAAASHREEVRNEIGVREDQILVGMIGRLVEEKGVPELIEAASRLGDGYVVAIAGPHDPEKDDSVTPEMIRQGEDSGVRFLGMRRDVERLYGAFDLFVLPSHREGFPRAAMEAAACGLPVIATDIRGCRQVVDEGVNGFLFPARDVDALVDRIVRAGENPSARVGMGEASVAKAEAEFDERIVVEKVIGTYRSLASRKGLAWAMESASPNLATIDQAMPADARSVARLHEKTITTGFLSTLGARFLMLLYSFLIQDDRSAVFVARQEEVVVGFIAGTTDTRALYGRFIRRRALSAVVALLPRLLRPSVLRGVLESLRQGSGSSTKPAELLSMAVAPTARRRGLGQRLVDRLLEWAGEQHLTGMKVVVGSANAGAIALYESRGFERDRQIEVHEGMASLELVWPG